MIPLANRLRKLSFPQPSQHFPALDGLRGLAILLVLAGHTASRLLDINPDENHWLFSLPWIRFGWSGVDLFFVLSGFLIGSQLCREYQRHGQIQVIRFLLKRGLRIWPLYFFVALLLLPKTPSLLSAWPDFTFLTNYFGETLLPGSWSLSIEEQFYVLAPLAISILAWKEGLIWLGPLLFAVAPFIRWLVLKNNLAAFSLAEPQLVARYLQRPLHTHFDGLLVGVFISFFATFHPELCTRLRPSAVAGAMVAMGVALGIISPVLFGYSGFALIYGGFLWYGLLGHGLSRRFLCLPQWRPLARLSYGIYLIHPIVLPYLVRGLEGSSLGLIIQWTIVFFGGTLVFMALAYLAFLAIELPFLNIRTRLFSAEPPVHAAPALRLGHK